MTAASAFPGTANPLQPLATAILIEVRATHIPANYVRNPHADPTSIVVTQGGVALRGVNDDSFTVAHVAEECRWAIDPEGEVLNQIDFEAGLTKMRLEYFEVLKVNGHPNASYPGNPDREHKPRAERYVARCVDPEDPSHLIDIGYNRHANAGARPENFVDAAGDALAETRLETLQAAYHDPKQRKALTPKEIAEVEGHIGMSGATPDGVANKLEVLTELHDAGDISDGAYMAKVAALTGATAQPVKEEPAKEEPVNHPKENARKPQLMVQALCLAECKGNRGLKIHERNCHKCRDIRAGASTGDSD